jgi:cytochrome b
MRLVWGFINSTYARFKSFPPSIAGSREQITDFFIGRPRIYKGHTPLGALMVYNLLACLGVIALSGHLMTTD